MRTLKYKLIDKSTNTDITTFTFLLDANKEEKFTIKNDKNYVANYSIVIEVINNLFKNYLNNNVALCIFNLEALKSSIRTIHDEINFLFSNRFYLKLIYQSHKPKKYHYKNVSLYFDKYQTSFYVKVKYNNDKSLSLNNINLNKIKSEEELLKAKAINMVIDMVNSDVNITKNSKLFFTKFETTLKNLLKGVEIVYELFNDC